MVIYDSQGEVIIFRDRQTNRQTLIIIYISSSSSKWSTLEPTFVIWCGRGGRWLLDKLPSLELITSLQSDQDFDVVLMIIMCQFCLFLLVQSHQNLRCWHFSKSYIKSISFAAGFSNRLVKGKNRKETDADIYLFFGREILGLSQKFRKSWGYHSFKDFLEFLLTNTFFCLVQYGAKVEIVANTKYFIGQRMKTTLAMAQPTQGLNALTNFNKVRPGVHISHPLLTICNLPKISFPSFQLLWQLLTAFGGVSQLSKVWKESNASSRLLKLPNSLCQVLGSHNLSLLNISTSLSYISLALGCWNIDDSVVGQLNLHIMYPSTRHATSFLSQFRRIQSVRASLRHHSILRGSSAWHDLHSLSPQLHALMPFNSKHQRNLLRTWTNTYIQPNNINIKSKPMWLWYMVSRLFKQTSTENLKIKVLISLYVSNKILF